MEEYFEVVDREGNVIDIAPRSECHSNPELIHRSVGVIITNSRGEILMQKRSMGKDTGPGKWDVSASGHLDRGESFVGAAERELKEELGLSVNIEPLFRGFLRTPQESEIYEVFLGSADGPFNPDPEEVDEVAFVDRAGLEKQMKSSPGEFTVFCHQVLGEYFRRFS